MPKLQTYTNYKPTGLDWLPEIPERWEVRRLKDLFNFNKGLNITKKDLIKNGIKCLNYGEIHSKYPFYLDTEKHELLCVPESLSQTNYYSLVNYGDFVFADTSEDIEGVGNFSFLKSKQTIFAGYHTIIGKTRKKEEYSYFAYLFDSLNFRVQVRKKVSGIKVYSITQKILRSNNLIYPPLQTQKAIAKYLDAKTAKVDKKIELLKCKKQLYTDYKQSLISETVRGQNSDLGISGEFKDSGVSWLPEIPERWEVRRVKDIFNISRGRVIPQTKIKDKGYPVYSSQTENDGCLGFIETYDFDSNLLTWTTDGVNAGTVFLRRGKFNCTNICGTLTPKKVKNIDLKYFLYSVQESAKHNKRIDTNGAKIMSNEMSIIKILFPPLQTQKIIAEYLDQKTQTIDKILANLDSQIKKLTEFRKSLINEAVTGKVKID